MRIKTLKRNTTNILRKGLEAKQAKASQVNLNLNVLVRQKKDVERELYGPEWQHLQAKFRKETEVELKESAEVDSSNADSWKFANGEHSSDGKALLQQKYDVLCEGITQKHQQILESNLMLESLKQKVCAISETNISRLMLELETGGNIRLEDGKPSDVWYTSCVDLVQSRVFSGYF
jgi:hypothetical protein